MFLRNPQAVSAGIQGQSSQNQGEQTYSTGPESGLVENWKANAALKYADTQWAMKTQIDRGLKQREEMVFQKTGQRLSHAYYFPELSQAVDDDAVKPSEFARDYFGKVRESAADESLANARDVERKIKKLRETDPSIPDFAQILADAKSNVQMLREQRDEVDERATTMGKIGGFIGGINATLNENNPWSLATLPVGGVGKTVAGRVATEFMSQSAIEYANQFNFIKKEREIYGDVFNPEDAKRSVLLAGAGGALFRGAFEAAPVLKNTVRDKALQTSIKMDELATKDTRVGRLAARITRAKTPQEAANAIREAPTSVVNSFVDEVDANPNESVRIAKMAIEPELIMERALPRGVEWADHVNTANQVNDTLERGEPLPDLTPATGNTIGRSLPAVPVRDLVVDAERFQFKEGGDSMGVTERLKGIQEWNPDLAGTIAVWEAKDGTRYIADGHQRTGLARRIMANNPNMDIRIPAHIYREVDGITPRDARYYAAIKNIGEGTGSALDTAKVFKYGDKESLDKVMRSLAPNQANVRQGKAIAALGDEAFRLAETTNVPQNYSALIADLTQDEAKQAAMMRLLIESEPDNAFMAQQIMRQALSDDFSAETTVDLFGEVTNMVPLYTDKAKVLDKALKHIGKEKSALANLVRNDDIVQAFGNTLNLDATQQGLDIAKSLQVIIEKQAFSKGPISDLLTQAAKEVQNGTSHGAAARGFTTLLREQIKANGLGSLLSDTAGKLDVQGKSFSEIAGIEQQNLFREAVEKTAPMGEPKAIEARFNDFKAAAGQAEMPASAKASGETSAAPQRIDQGASVATQAAPSQRTKRLEPSPVFSTAKMSPSKEKGGLAKIGEVDASTGKRILHKMNDVKTLLGQAEKTVAPLKEWLTVLSKDIKGIEVAGVRAKDIVTMEDKAKWMERPANQISDYLGARVTFDSMEAMREFMAKFEGEAKVIDKEDFLQSGRQNTGYRAIHLQALTKDGFSYELQVMPKTIYDVYEEGRQGYAAWKALRGKEDLTDAQIAKQDAAFAKDKEIYDKAWQKFTESGDEAANIEARFATIDPNEELPMDGFAVKYEDGREVPQFKTVRDMLADIEESDAIAKAATECLL